MQSDTIEQIAKAAKGIIWEMYFLNDRLLITDASEAIGIYVELDEPFLDDEFKINTESLYEAFRAMDGDVTITETDDEAYVIVEDGATTVKLRKKTVRDSGFSLDPSNLLGKPELKATIDAPYDAISEAVRTGQKITDSDTAQFDADDDTMTVLFDTKGSSYKTDISLDSQTLPTSSMYDAKLMKKLDGAVFDDESIKMGDDFPFVVESTLNDARVLAFVAPRVPE